MSAHAESAISHRRPTTEPRARTTAVAIVDATQNGTSGVLPACKQAPRWVPWDTLRTGFWNTDNYSSGVTTECG